MPVYRHKSTPMSARLRRERSSASRIIVTFVAFFAFVLQSYVTQTHIHIEGESAFGFATAKTVTPDTASKSVSSQNREHGRHVPSDDPAHCPFCQEILYAGHFVAPAPVAEIQLAFIAAPTVIAHEISVITSPVSHSWRGRGPPLP
jgi:hypothetical protein